MERTYNQEKKSLTGSIFVKVLVYFILTASFLVGSVAGIFTGALASKSAYSYGNSLLGMQVWVKDFLCTYALEDARYFYNLRWPEDTGELETLLSDYCENKNIQMEVLRTIGEEAPELMVSNYTGYNTPFAYSRSYMEYERIEVESETVEMPKESEVSGSGAIYLEDKPAENSSDTVSDGVDVNASTTYIPESELLEEGQQTQIEVTEKMADSAVEKPIDEPVYKDIEVYYEIRVYVNPQFPVYDQYQVTYNRSQEIWEVRNVFPIVSLVCIILFILCFIFLMCGAGHRNGRSGITPSVLTPIHFDVLTAAFGFVAILGVIASVELSYGYSLEVYFPLFILMLTAVVVWCTIYCGEFALRLKQGNWWKHTLIYVILRFIGRCVRFCVRALGTLVRGLPLVINTIIIFVGVCIVELLLFMLWGVHDGPFIWILEKVILFPIILYIALVCKKLQEGSKALAEGNLNHKLDTTKMVLDFKEHGENLNQIGQGISKAVEERMKSEHLKTELITNVSHDLKTTLTSIINYADLLGNAAASENQLSQEKVAEYSEVLLRQSKRLKKLLEDLVEASKATTGNLEVTMEKCEVGVLLSQAVGEYEQRFWDKQLEAIVRQPEQPIWIMADGRRLWRVFDNLLNNICKYAQENTRVYLTVAPRDASVEIIFRNMSKYPLELSAEELEERFVRGDKSRHMEGNGLGLSIAKSLVELQNGSMEIVTDGDLFKVTLRFPVIE